MRDPSAGRNCSFENKLEPGLVTGQRFYREAPQRSDTSAYAGFSSSRSTVSPMRCDSYQARPDRRCAVRTGGWHHARHSRTDFLAGDLRQCLIGDGRRCVRAECRGTDIETLPIRRARPADGRNAAFDHAGNVAIAAVARIVGWVFSQRAVFLWYRSLLSWRRWRYGRSWPAPSTIGEPAAANRSGRTGAMTTASALHPGSRSR